MGDLGALSEVELVIMATLGCSATQAQIEYQELEPILINLNTPGLLGYGAVTAATLNVRTTPGTGVKVVGTLTQGQKLEIWGRARNVANGLWLCVRAGSIVGWVSAAYIQELQPT